VRLCGENPDEAPLAVGKKAVNGRLVSACFRGSKATEVLDGSEVQYIKACVEVCPMRSGAPLVT
jgi:hypothetical protein